MNNLTAKLDEIMKELNAKLKVSKVRNEKMVEEVLRDVFPVTSDDNEYTLHFVNSYLDETNYEAPNEHLLYATAPLYAKFRLENNASNFVVENEIFLGDLPILFN